MKVFMLVSLMVASAVVGNLLLKSAANASEGESILGQLLHVQTIVGLSLFAGAALGYLLLLKLVPLNVAQSFMALQFVGVVLGSYLILEEPLPMLRLVGVTLIALGVVVVGSSQA